MRPAKIRGGMNKLYYGDNLEILRAHIPDESVKLVYLDPPFNSSRTYNVLCYASAAPAVEAPTLSLPRRGGPCERPSVRPHR